MSSHVFQIVNWHNEDVEIEHSDAESDEEAIRQKYIIKLFGVGEDGGSISVSVTGFTPYFYVKCFKAWSSFEIKRLEEALRSRLRSYNGIIDIKPMKKKDFWGFTNNEDFWFLRICFETHTAMKFAARAISSPNFYVSGVSQKKFKLYESNIEPFLRFAHIKNIQPAGWVSIPKAKCTEDDILPTKCDLDIKTRWSHVSPVDKEDIAPILIASFDLECMSSDGDFPVPEKDYKKLAIDMFNIYKDHQKNRKDDYYAKKAITSYVVDLFEKKMVLPKNANITGKTVSSILAQPLDHVVTIVRGDKTIMEKAFVEKFRECFTKQDDSPEKCLSFYKKISGDKMTMTALRKSLYTWMTKCFESKQETLVRDLEIEEEIEILLKILFIDKDGVINVLTKYLNNLMPSLKGDEIIQIGTTYHRYGSQDVCRKVLLSLGTCDPIEGTEVIVCETETDLITSWARLIEESNPDIVTGYNIFGFDFSYIYGRAKELGCKNELCKIGRLKDRISSFKTAKLSSSALGDNIMRYIEMEGRTIVDLMKVIQRDHKLDSYKLDLVASHFMGMNKNDVSPQDIFRLYRGEASDRKIIAEYCIQDCALCNKLMMKLEIVANNVGMANVCSVPFGWIFMRGQGVKIFSLVAKACKEDGFLVPVVRKPQKTGEEDDADESYEGAIVLEPKVGIYIDTPVSVLDYASLYPSSMISENISHDSIVLDEKYDNLLGVEYLDITFDLFEKDGDEKKKVGERTCRFVQPPNGEKGLLPKILMHLLKQRKTTRKKIELKRVTLKDGTQLVGFYKKDGGNITDMEGKTTEFDKNDIQKVEDVYNSFQKAVLDGLQLAYKVTANSLYGQMGASTSPLYCQQLASSTTATGRKMIMLAKEFLEKEYNANVVYGDTDSLFNTFPDQLKTDTGEVLKGKEALQKTIELGIEASKKIKPLLKPPHDLEWEKAFWPMILFSKKRYCANKYEHDINKFKQSSMGIVLKRRDNANIVKKIYGGIIDIILNQHDVAASIKFFKQSLQELIDGKYPLEDLVVSKTLKAHYKDPDKIAHKALAERIKERTPGLAPQVNDRIPYVYIQVKDDKKVLQGDRIEDPNYVKEKKLKPDYMFYITNQIMNPCLQLYAIVLEQLDGYKLPSDYWEKEKEKLKAEGKSAKFIQGKIQDMRENEVKRLLLEPILNKLSLAKQGQSQITSFFKVL